MKVTRRTRIQKLYDSHPRLLEPSDEGTHPRRILIASARACMARTCNVLGLDRKKARVGDILDVDPTEEYTAVPETLLRCVLSDKAYCLGEPGRLCFTQEAKSWARKLLDLKNEEA